MVLYIKAARSCEDLLSFIILRSLPATILRALQSSAAPAPLGFAVVKFLARSFIRIQ